MIKVMIVDDEREIRKGLHLKVDWEELGFQIVSEAVNGADAIDKLVEQHIDVVFTDMNMPIMDGIALLSHIQGHHPHIKSVVLTGYDDFAYTKAAIRHRAVEYLLKPVMPDELQQLLLQIRESILVERQQLLSHKESSRKHQRWYREIRENFALHILKGDLSPVIIDKAAQIHMSSWDQSSIQVISFGLQEYGRKNSADLLNIEAIARELSDSADPSMHRKSDEPSAEKFQLPFELMARELAEQYADGMIVCKDSNYPNLLHVICCDGGLPRAQMLDSYITELKQHLGFELVLGISGEARGFEQWYHAYMDALLQWSLHNSELHQETATLGHISKLDDEMLTRLLQKDDLSPLLQYIRTIFTEAMLRSHTELVRKIFEMLITLERVIQGENMFSQRLWLNPEQVLKLTTVDKALNYIGQYLQESHQAKKQESNEDLFHEVLAYIGENYVYEITLPSLAERFNYNSSYFSELFKSKVGQTFVQYLSEVRMKHACQLLETTDLGLSDIAELTGFSNASYFSSRFKKSFNISPSEYRMEKSGSK